MKTKIAKYISTNKIMAGVLLLVLILVSAANVAAQTVTQGYGSDQPLQRGMIVQLNKDDPSKVEPVSIATSDTIQGIVVDPNDAPVTLSAEGEKVFVADRGKFDVLVSDQNGPINPGDYVAVSSVNGIGMKVDERAPVVVGKALVGYDGSTSVSTAIVNDQTVRIGRVPVDISIGANPIYRPKQNNLPEFLKQAAEDIAGKPVSTVKIYVSIIVFLVSGFVAGSILYGGIKSSIISIGRNPLSKKSIVRGMVQVILTGLIIFIIGLFGVYLILKL